MCDEHVFTAWSSQVMPKSGVKATVGSLSLGASGLLSAVSRFFPLFCLSLLLGCTRTEALTSLRPRVTAGAAPSPSSSLRPRAALPLLSSWEKPHLQPPELLPSPPTTTCPFLCHGPASQVTRQRRTQGRKESPNWWSPHLGLSSLPPQFTLCLAARLPPGGPEFGDRCFREERKKMMRGGRDKKSPPFSTSHTPWAPEFQDVDQGLWALQG